MPINWQSPETFQRLLAAIMASQDLKLDYRKIATFYGDGATYDAIEGRFRKIKLEAKGLREQVGSGNSSATSTPRKARNNASATGTPRSGNTHRGGGRVADGRVSKTSSAGGSPSKSHRSLGGGNGNGTNGHRSLPMHGVKHEAGEIGLDGALDFEEVIDGNIGNGDLYADSFLSTGTGIGVSAGNGSNGSGNQTTTTDLDNSFVTLDETDWAGMNGHHHSPVHHRLPTSFGSYRITHNDDHDDDFANPNVTDDGLYGPGTTAV